MSKSNQGNSQLNRRVKIGDVIHIGDQTVYVTGMVGEMIRVSYNERVKTLYRGNVLQVGRAQVKGFVDAYGQMQFVIYAPRDVEINHVQGGR